MASRSSLDRVKLGHRVKLLAYVDLSGIGSSPEAMIGYRVTSGPATVFFERKAVTLDPSQNGSRSFWTYWTPKKMGTDKFTATFFFQGTHRHKTSPAFQVAKGVDVRPAEPRARTIVS